MKKIRLSQCMIVKNEEKNIRRALSWGKGIVFEQIVVDTGSTDRTVEIAKEMEAQVFHFPWIQDFSAAKNYAIEQAHGDWIAFLDADEYFTEVDALKIMPLLKSVQKQGKMGPRVEIFETKLVSLNDDGKPFSEDRQLRLFRNFASLRYHNRIHEQLEVWENGTKRSPVGIDVTDSLTIFHTGYAPSVYQETKKLDRNIAMLKKEVEINPCDWNMKVYLAEALSANQQKVEAERLLVEVYEQGLTQLEEGIRDLLFAAMLKGIADRSLEEDRERLFEVYNKAREMNNHNPDFDFYLGLWFLHQEDYEQVLSYMKQALEWANNGQGKFSIRLTSRYDRLYHIMTQASLKLKRYSDVVRYGVLCLKAQPYTTEVLAILLTLLKNESGESETAAGTFGILDRIYDFTSIKDKTYIQQCAKAVGFAKLAEVMESLFTEQERAWRDE